jgi:glycine cleavage system H lipoate-binding protein
MIKIRSEINEMVNKKPKRINETKSWIFKKKKANKIENPWPT